MKKNVRSAVCRIANRLTANGYSRSEAMRKAWTLARLPDITTRVAGTASQLVRQTALEHLTRYDPADVSFRLAADTENRFDPNAVAVISTVRGKGSFRIGYLKVNFDAYLMFKYIKQ